MQPEKHSSKPPSERADMSCTAAAVAESTLKRRFKYGRQHLSLVQAVSAVEEGFPLSPASAGFWTNPFDEQQIYRFTNPLAVKFTKKQFSCFQFQIEKK